MANPPSSTARVTKRTFSAVASCLLLLMCMPAFGAARGALTPTMAQLTEAERELSEVEAALEQRYGYAGSKATVAEHLAGTRAPGASERVAARVYVLWRKVQPFFQLHIARVAALREAWAAQGHILAHERVWIESALASMQSRARAHQAGIDRIISLSVERVTLRAALAEAEANLAATKNAMSGLGSQGMSDLLSTSRQAISDATAKLEEATAAISAHEKTLIAQAQHAFIPRYVSPAERALHPLTQVDFAPAPPSPARPPTAQAAPLATLSVQIADSEAAVLALEAKADAARQAAKHHRQAAEALSTELASVRAPVDLPEVRAGMTKRGALEARINAQRDAIRAIDTSKPGGYEEAEQAAQQVITLQGELPGLDAELVRLRSKSYLESWRRATRTKIAEARASAQIQTTEAERAARQIAKVTAEAMQLRGELVDAALGLQLQVATSLAQSTKAFPTLIGVAVTRPTREGDAAVLQVERPTHSAVVASIIDMQAARAALGQAVATLARAWKVQAEADAAALPLNLDISIVDDVIARVWKRSVARLAVKGLRGTTKRVVRSAFASPPASASSARLEPDAAARVPAGDLALALERFTGVMTSKVTQTGLRKAVMRALNGIEGQQVDIGSSEVEAIARRTTQLALQPFLHLAAAQHRAATRSTEEAGEASSLLCAGVALAMQGKATTGVPLRVGDPVSVTLRFESPPRGGCPTVRLGNIPIASAKKSSPRTCHYPLMRLAPLPSGPATLTIASQP
ncbi:MAG: hypothetical protein ACPGU1_07035 [Myxococcota bacterium]